MQVWHGRERHLQQGGSLKRKTADDDKLIEAVTIYVLGV